MGNKSIIIKLYYSFSNRIHTILNIAISSAYILRTGTPNKKCGHISRAIVYVFNNCILEATNIFVRIVGRQLLNSKISHNAPLINFIVKIRLQLF